MKRLLPLLCLLLLLSGCAGAPQHQAKAAAPEKAVHLSAPVVTRPTPPSLLDILVPLDGVEGVYELKSEAMTDCFYPSMTDFCGQLLLCSQRYDAEDGISKLELVAMNCHTGAVSARTDFPVEAYIYPQVRNGVLYLCDSRLGWIKELDRGLNLVSDTAVEPTDSQWLINGDGTALYQISFMEGCTRLELASGTSTPCATEVHSLFSTNQNDQYAFLSYIGTDELLDCAGTLDFATGDVEQAPFDDTMSSVSRWGERWLGYRFDGAYSYYDGQQTWVIEPSEGYDLLMLEGTGHLLMRNYAERHLKLYDTDGTFLGECTLDMGAECFPNDDLVWNEVYGGYFITVTAPDGSARLLFWQIDGASGESLALQTEAEYEALLPGDAVDRALYERAALLSEQYGVEIHIADQCGTEYSDYVTVQVTDEAAITAALDTLERVLASYPEGFLDQLVYGSIRKIEIHLSGPLTGRDGYEMSTAGAFTQPAGEVYLMVMDIYQFQLEYHFYHEFSHIIDHNLEWHAQYEDILFSEADWRALSPVEADYSFSYGDWPSVWDNGLDAWFIDSYARTFPTEDRARVLEYAMTGSDWAFDEQHQPLREKLRYYAECIRDCFNTEGWPEVCLWEEPLQEG